MALPSPAEKRDFVERMFDGIAGHYDLMNRIMTLGIDRTWRRATIATLGPVSGALVADLGCGTGDLCHEARKAGARVVGVDLSRAMLELAAERLPSAAWLRADVASLPFADASVDAVVSGFALRNFSSVAAVLDECGRVLRPGGRVALLEVNPPTSSLGRAAFDVYMNRVVPLVGRVFSKGYAYRYLAESMAYLPSDAELEAMLTTAGFAQVRKTKLATGAAQLVTAMRV